MSLKHVLLLTGRPGVGKTMVIRRVAESLSGWRLSGFYTEEIRVGGQRQGFRAVTFDGSDRIMAYVDIRSAHRVGKYKVDISVIDELATSTLALKPGVDLYLADEIGRMECLSQTFVVAMRRLLTSQSVVVATIAQKGGGFIAEVKQRSDVELWEVTQANRDELPKRVLGWLKSARVAGRMWRRNEAGL